MEMLLRAALVMSAMVSGFGGQAWADAWPSKPIRIIVPLAAGGGTDVVARVIAEKLGERLGQSVFVDNRPGAEGLIGVDAAAKSAPDGYTIVLGSSTTMAAIVSLYAKLPFDPVKDFVPVSKALDNAWNVFLVPTALPAQNLKELIAFAKSNPGKLNYGAGTASSKICIEMFKVMAGVNITLVPYKASTQALNDLIGGQVQLVCEPVGSGMQNVKAGRLRAVGVTAPTRIAEIPDVPTVAESAGLPGYEHSSWLGFFAPANTPKEIVDRLAAELVNVLKQPEMIGKIKALGFDAVPTGPDELGALQKDTVARYAKLVKDAGIVPQ